jgi:GT2 family glycosyltransferase
MPVRSGERWLNDAVASVLSQTLAELELIIVDDGSSDGVARQIEALASRDRRIRVCRQDRLGLVAALNKGLSLARAPLLARLDADDLAHQQRLERQVKFLAEHAGVGVVGTWTIEIDASGGHLKTRRPPCDPEALRQLLSRGNPFVHSSIMGRTELLRALGGYRAAFEAAEDYDLWLRVAEVSQLANLNETLTYYRVHSDGVSANGALRQSFSVRLAQRAAAARLAQLPDPAEYLDGPPDWRCAQDQGAFAQEIALYRSLDPTGGPPASSISLHQFDGLNHAERRLVALSLLSHLRSTDSSQARRARTLLINLLRQRPRAVMSAVWSLRQRLKDVRSVWSRGHRSRVMYHRRGSEADVG